MSRLYFSLFLFIAGFGLSFLVVSSGALSSAFKPDLSVSELIEEQREAPADEPAAPIEIAEQSIDAGRRPQIFREVMQSGSEADLYLIRPEYISSFPDYEENLLPMLKREGLKNLLQRFTESDWEDWPNSAYGENGGPSAARLYVDDINSVNVGLGAYLETAAYLFHRLVKKVGSGEDFELAYELRGAYDKAEQILRHRKSPAIPARYSLNPQIGSDAIFLEELELLRCRAVSRGFVRNTRPIDEQLDLLVQLKVSHCGQEIIDGVGHLVNILTLDGTPESREAFLKDKAARKAIKFLSLRSPKISEALARFFAVVSVDFMQVEEYELAEMYLEKSIQAKPGMKIQELVASFLYVEVEVDEDYVEEEVQAAPLEELPSEEVIDPESLPPPVEEPAILQQPSEGAGVLGTLLTLFAIAAGVGIILFFWKRLQVGSGGHAEYAEPVDISSDDQFWDSDFEMEEEARDSEVNRNY